MANASIKYLKDENGNMISPVVNIKSIFDNEGTSLLDIIYPVGSIYMSVKSTNPGTLFGGIWTAWGTGRVPVGINTSDTSFNTVEKTGGNKTVSISAHTHNLGDEGGATLQTERPGNDTLYWEQRTGPSINWKADYRVYTKVADSSLTNLNNEGQTRTLALVGKTKSAGSQSVNTLQPYITCYMWKRTK